MVFAGEMLGQKYDWLSDIALDDLFFWRFFYSFDLPVICASVLLGYLLGLVTLYMLLIMVYIVYHYAFIGGAVVLDFLNLLYDNMFFVSFLSKLLNKFCRVTVEV